MFEAVKLAIKIASIVRTPTGRSELHFDGMPKPVLVPRGWVFRNKAVVGGFYVVLMNGTRTFWRARSQKVEK